MKRAFVLIAYFLGHWLSLALGLFIISQIPFLGISASRPLDLLYASFILLLVNTFIRPLIILISLPLVLLSLGLFYWVINAFILSWLSVFVPGFQVTSLLGAFIGSILLSLITGMLQKQFQAPNKAKLRPGPQINLPGKGEIIDID